MYARVATFESDPATVEDAINLVRARSNLGTCRPDSRARRC